jgi:hypothetical protein
MSITFYVSDLDTRIQSAPATITPRELASFRTFMREAGIETEDDPKGEPEQLTYSFDASICRFSLATLSRLFDFRHEIIAVVEEAQFLGRLLSFRRNPFCQAITIEVSHRLDGADELDLAYGNAYAILEALKIKPESVGDIPLSELRERLADPTIRGAFTQRRVEHRLPFFDRFAALNSPEQNPRLVWA